MHSRPGPRVHPALARAPLALLLAALAADLAGTATGARALWTAGAYLALAGAAAGAVAAIPGAADYLRALPPRGTGRKRARRHALLVLAALALFALCGWVRGHPEVPPDPGVLLFEGVGAALLVTGGWLGRRLAREDDGHAT